MTPALLPRPRQVTELGDGVTWAGTVTVAAADETVEVLRLLLGEGPGITFAPTAADAQLVIAHVDGLDPGAYTLHCSGTVRIGYGDDAGLVHAVQTLRQLLPAATFARGAARLGELRLPGVDLADAPVLRWRGAHLDVARHFQPLPWLYEVVDLLAMHKLNVLHLHLTDDQGWRFEVHRYPRLTEAGATRAGTRYPHWPESDGVPHGGYYTQDQLRSLVAYAGVRGVTVVPEIDLPGHVRALLTAYPEFGEPGAAAPGVAETFGVFDEVLHLGDETMTMVEGVFEELLDVFDAPWIHVGGDECPRTQWRASAAAGELAARRGLPGVDHLQRWFTEHLRGWLADRGRTLVGWDEIIAEAAVPGAVVMSWRGTEPGLRALAAGNEVVMTPAVPYYLDHYAAAGEDEPHAIGGRNTWESVAGHDPFAGVPPDQRHLLLGVQAALWSEYLPDPRRVEYAAFPRLCALAETAWTGAAADPAELEPRLAAHLERLTARGANVRQLAGPAPWQRGGGRYRRAS